MNSNNNDTISNIINNNKKNSNSSNNSSNIEKCKTLLMSKPMIPMLSIKNIIIGSIGTLIPWIILLFIVAFIIVI
jgi:hypothetical protein